MVRSFFIFILSGVILFAGCSPSNRTATCLYSSAIERMALPVISFDATNFTADGKPRLDVLFQIPLKNLKFQKEANTYTAQYTVTARILDDDEKQITVQEWSKTVTVNDYRRTISEEREATLRVFSIPPGKYTLAVTILDEHSQQKCDEQKKITIRPVAGSFDASDIVLLKKITEEQGIKTITPILPEDVGRVRFFSTFMEVYDSVTTDTLRVNSRITSYHIDYDNRQQRTPHPYISTVPQLDLFIPRFDTVVARSDTAVVAVGSPTQVFQTFSVPPPGRYQLLTVVIKGESVRNDTLMIGRTFTIRSEYFPDVIDIDDLISPLQYITRNYEYDSLTAPAGKEERGRRLEDYWNTKFDRTLRQEFYLRVRKANEYFTGVVDGWRTPMGMVYIVAGPPSELECIPGRSETWYYDYQQVYVSFVFQTGPVKQDSDQPLYMLTGYPLENVWSTFVYRWRR